MAAASVCGGAKKAGWIEDDSRTVSQHLEFVWRMMVFWGDLPGNPDIFLDAIILQIVFAITM